MSKIRVGVIRGGPSSEYDVSLLTGAHVIKNLPEDFQPVDILIDREGKWHVRGIEEAPAKIFKKIDVVWNALHGEYGEDGKIQHLFETFGVPYTGSGRIASALSMHKLHAKNALKRHGIKSPYHKIVRKEELSNDLIKELWKTILQPSIVKPVSLGSSIGVSVANNFKEFVEAIEHGISISDKILIEEFIRGREATCGVIENFRGEDEYAMFPAEMALHGESKFLDFDAKYNGKHRAIHPGRFSAKEKNEMQEISKLAHKALGLRHYSRSDFIVSPKRGVFYLETNSLPFLEKESAFMGSLHAVGVSSADFLNHTLNLALGRNSV